MSRERSEDPASSPMPVDTRRLPRNLEMLARAAAEATAFLGLAILLGWALDLPLLRMGVPGSLSVKANSALGFLAAGLAARTLASRRAGPRGRLVAQVTGMAVAAVGLFTLVEYVVGVDLGFDQLLFQDPAGATPGRMAPNSALAFLFIGLALALHDVETEAGTRPAQLLALAAALVPLQALIGYAYGVEPMEGLAANTRVPFYAGIGFFLLVTALLFDRPQAGMMRVFTAPGLAGFMARRLIGAVFVVPVALGWFFLVVGLRAGKYEALLGGSFVVVSAVVVAAAVVYWNALALGDMESERLRAEETERKQREWLRITLASIGDAVVATDVGGSVTLVNAVAEKLTGAGPDAVGRPLAEVFRAVDGQGRPIPDPVETALRSGGPTPLGAGVILRGAGGREYPVEGSVAPIRAAGGEPQGVAIVFADRTEARRGEAERAALLEREQVARAEAERASRAKDEFIATVSHELRTPLNAVLGWARLLRTGRLDPAATERAMEAIERSATTQAQIVDDLLDVARIVRGRLKLDVEEADLAVAVEAAAETVRPAANAKGITLFIDLEAGAGVVRGDPARLQQVVWNLLANAIKFTPTGGRVEVSVRRLEDTVRLEVRDDGSGIDPGFLPHVFERFRQADSSPTRAHGGLGIGLAIVRHLVEAHGGSVHAWSAGRNQGSTFTVDLPLPADAPRLPPRPPAPSGQRPWPSTQEAVALADLHVLVVDDDPDTLDAVRQLLEQAGARVSTASSAAAGFRALCGEPPDVLLSDIGMPGEDGLSLIRRVRGLDPSKGGRVPAAAFTAYTLVADRERALDAGFQAFLPKPVDPRELAAAIARLAGRST
jgi:PAS domain S-box-containing protein